MHAGLFELLEEEYAFAQFSTADTHDELTLYLHVRKSFINLSWQSELSNALQLQLSTTELQGLSSTLQSFPPNIFPFPAQK